MQYELSDVSIVSDRVQRRPEGLSPVIDRTVGNGSQPTRTMKRIDGSHCLAWCCGKPTDPRDFSMMIRGQGAKTTFAVRDIKCTRKTALSKPIGRLLSVGYSRPVVHAQRGGDAGALHRCMTTMRWAAWCISGPAGGGTSTILKRFVSGGSVRGKQAFAVGKQHENLDISVVCQQRGGRRYIRNSNYHPDDQFEHAVQDRRQAELLFSKPLRNFLDARVPDPLDAGTVPWMTASRWDRQTCVFNNQSTGCTLLNANRRNGGWIDDHHRRHLRSDRLMRNR